MNEQAYFEQFRGDLYRFMPGDYVMLDVDYSFANKGRYRHPLKGTVGRVLERVLGPAGTDRWIRVEFARGVFSDVFTYPECDLKLCVKS